MRFRGLLLDTTLESEHERYLHAAVVARGKRIVGVGVNGVGVHAEVAALKEAGEKSRGATLYTLMVRRKTGTVGNGCPCSKCMKVIREMGVKRVIVYV